MVFTGKLSLRLLLLFFQNKAIYNATMAQLMYMNILYTKLTDVLAKNTKQNKSVS